MWVFVILILSECHLEPTIRTEESHCETTPLVTKYNFKTEEDCNAFRKSVWIDNLSEVQDALPFCWPLE